jgi:hypothetical protein
LPPGENKNRSNHLAQTGSELLVPIATFPVDRRNQILLTSQLSYETTSKLLFITDGPKTQGKEGKNPTVISPSSSPREVAPFPT